MAKIRWTEEVVQWLENIFDYIAKETPCAAQRVVEGIYEKARILKSFPKIDYKHRNEPEGEIRHVLRVIIKALFTSSLPP